MKGWTLFLDRDGVINKLLPGRYVQTIEEFEFIPTIFEALAKANTLFDTIVVVTNQQGIGKGLMSERNLLDIHTYCKKEVEKNGGRIDAFYFAPALAAENSELRKPNTGMPLLAQRDFPSIDFKKSFLVGDSISDLEMGKKLEMTTIYITENKEKQIWADFCHKDVLEWINTLLK